MSASQRLRSFGFQTAGKILFGSDASSGLAAEVSSMGQRPFVVTGRRQDVGRRLLELFETAVFYSIPGEPTVELVAGGVAAARAANCDVVVAVGGGAAIDAGKAISALLRNHGDIFDYLEVIGQGRPLSKPPAPFVAVPTTAGTGAEVTRNAVLSSPEHRVKVSMRSPLMLPTVAIIDPLLTLTMPPALTAATGLDALTQLLEAFMTRHANAFTDSMCSQGVPLAARSLRNAFLDGSNQAAREDMSMASLMGGIALANAGLGAVHGVAGPIGGMFEAPHGAVCGRLLPLVLAANLSEIRRLDMTALHHRFDQMAVLLTSDPSAAADAGIAFVQSLCDALAVPGLSAYGIGEADVTAIVAKAQQASSMRGNPVDLSTQILKEIVLQAL